jgi:mannose-6-phosphate isomerase-like protein (cupin superfamily)
MRIRRVVTATDDAGKARVVSDAGPPLEQVLQHTPGFVSSPIWMTAAVPNLSTPDDATAPGASLLAAPGGATFLVVTFPPDASMMVPEFDPAAAGQEHAAAAPGIAETFELDHPGMHRTPTLDYVTVVKGRIVLELDDGETVELGPGDTVVQHGVRHAWRNPGDEPATLSFVMLGARTG